MNRLVAKLPPGRDSCAPAGPVLGPPSTTGDQTRGGRTFRAPGDPRPPSRASVPTCRGRIAPHRRRNTKVLSRDTPPVSAGSTVSPRNTVSARSPACPRILATIRALPKKNRAAISSCVSLLAAQGRSQHRRLSPQYRPAAPDRAAFRRASADRSPVRGGDHQNRETVRSPHGRR
jgi:hypothetical protein